MVNVALGSTLRIAVFMLDLGSKAIERLTRDDITGASNLHDHD
jgi:hypothetical protein